MKRSMTLILTIIFILVTAVPVYGTEGHSNGTTRDSAGFSDVPADHWAYNAINWMVGNGIVEGTGENQFMPARGVTRDEYAKMMVLTLNLKLINPPGESFLDIKKGGWQFKYVETAKPYMTGFRTAKGDYFKPSDSAVREDMAVALVKALGFSNETTDPSVLSQFSDEAQISPNLKKYVAIAVSHGLMEGYESGGKKVFAPNEGLNRASAAVLLYNAFKENEDKIAYDDEKVTYDDVENSGEEESNSEEEGADEETDHDTGLVSSDIRVSISGDKALLSWDRITSSSFTGYKVVISRNDSTPVYPDNGYLAYITDRNTTSMTVKAGDGYNGGDIGGNLKSGVDYYFSITVLYNDGKVPGNVVRTKLPAGSNEEDEDFSAKRSSNIRVNVSGDRALLSWDRINSSDFNGYKVVISRNDSNPAYPDDGYFAYITDRNTTSITVKAGDCYNGGDIGGNLESGVNYYFSITVLYNDGKTPGNAIRAKLP
ncbi:MAG TPA: S-layer homology domain-containing protein [Clostridia bacterium]|nr:S-layer homology domain-containing protein [Clostridia bacterium]